MPDAKIRVLLFKTTYERHPVKGDPLNDTVDEKGFKLDPKGKRIMQNVEEDWVVYAPAHSPLNTVNEERIRHMRVTEEMLRGEQTEKLELMTMRWAQIEPAYEAWKTGHEVPVNGTPFSAWAGVTSEKAEVLRRHAIRTVEEIADLSEGQMEKIPLPGMRELRKQAKIFLEGRGAAEAAQAQADAEARIAALEAQLAENNERLSAAMDLLEEKTSPTDEIARLKAELDEKGIPYHPRHGADTLRKLLAGAPQTEAA
jgi:hypothetical protein